MSTPDNGAADKQLRSGGDKGKDDAAMATWWSASHGVCVHRSIAKGLTNYAHKRALSTV